MTSGSLPIFSSSQGKFKPQRNNPPTLFYKKKSEICLFLFCVKVHQTAFNLTNDVQMRQSGAVHCTTPETNLNNDASSTAAGGWERNGLACFASAMSSTARTSSSALANLCAIVSFGMAHGNADSSLNCLSRHSAPSSSVSERLSSRAAQQIHLYARFDAQYRPQNAARSSADIVSPACNRQIMFTVVAKPKFFCISVAMALKCVLRTKQTCTTLHKSPAQGTSNNHSSTQKRCQKPSASGRFPFLLLLSFIPTHTLHSRCRTAAPHAGV